MKRLNLLQPATGLGDKKLVVTNSVFRDDPLSHCPEQNNILE